jgi:signal peptidase II
MMIIRMDWLNNCKMELLKKISSRALIIIISIIFLVGCDQTTKKIANKELKSYSGKEIAGIINLHYIENDGGMLSLGSKLPQKVKFTIFILMVSVFLLLLFLYVIKNQHVPIIKQTALILILSGGLGNLIDRIFNNGRVVDFIRIKIPIMQSGIFNIADFYVTLGFVLLIFEYIVNSKHSLQKQREQ